MIGGALPVKMQVEIGADAAPDTICRIVELAEQSSPAQVYMREVLTNTFALGHNGVATPVTNVTPSPAELRQTPLPHLEAARPLSDDTFVPDIIVKQKTAEAVFGVEGGAGSSLQATQKRTLHVRGICTIREDGLKEVLVQLFKPLGSTFRFIGDDTEQERAPASLAYLAAGIGFCFMTQIGRYAHIVKQDLKGYSISQDTIYKVGADSAEAHPVDTHTFLQTSEDDEAAQRTLYMSERTCFLHAAMRGSNKTQISVVLNGTQL
jgi:organic hydroperoxide reductase OsmC/OhrA